MGVTSETGRLETVLVHRPGREVEQMTPETAEALLYNDIVPVEMVQEEHDQLRAVLSLVAETVEIGDELALLAERSSGRAGLAAAIAGPDTATREYLLERWSALPGRQVATECIEGIVRTPASLQDLQPDRRYVTPPLPNLYFTRDATFCVHGHAFRSAMASPVRRAEAAITGQVLAARGIPVRDELTERAVGARAGRREDPTSVKVEGGDVLVLSEDVVLLGMGERSSAEGLDVLIAALSAVRERPLTVLVAEVPAARATIHLDMVVTAINEDELLGYLPLLEGRRAMRTWRLDVPADGSRWSVTEYAQLRSALDSCGLSCDVIACGGDDPVVSEREQWFSGCNSVALAPGVIIVYRNNAATLAALSDRGYRIVTGDAVLADPSVIVNAVGDITTQRTAIAINGVELARGGGGPRCMTMPVSRRSV